MNLSLILKLQILYSNMLTMLTILLQNLFHFYSTSEAKGTHMSKRTHISRRANAELSSLWCLNFPDFHLVSQKIGSGSIPSWLSWWLKGGRSWERVGSINCFIDPLLSKWRQRENIDQPLIHIYFRAITTIALDKASWSEKRPKSIITNRGSFNQNVVLFVISTKLRQE